MNGLTTQSLEGGGRRVGVKNEGYKRQLRKSLMILQVAPHPNPLPQGERRSNF